MTTHITLQDAQLHLADLIEQVQRTGEPVLIEQAGQPAVALIRPDGPSELERLRSGEQGAEFGCLARVAAYSVSQPELTEDEIVRTAAEIRETLYRERYGE